MSELTPTSDADVILDLSRLLSRVLHPTPTGVDRCEMAYARGLIAMLPQRLSFAAVHPSGLYGRLPFAAVLRFLDRTEERWQHGGFRDIWDARSFATAALTALRPRIPPPKRGGRTTLYIQASPNNLTRPKLVAAILKRERAKFICLVHDLIPLQYPEYARPDGAKKHLCRIETMASLADGVIANSQATLSAFQPYLEAAGRTVPAVVAHLGADIHSVQAVDEAARPYLVCVGTIEPRKNHLLLLNLWRQLSEQYGALNIPKLLIIGRRGWENEQVVDMLERCRSLDGCVEEWSGLPDTQVHRLIAGARGLLLPSFAEGYGMPVTEALSLGTPVVCSDLPALREAGGDAPIFLDPLDGPAWRAAILELASERSELISAHAERLVEWRAPTWPNHLAIVGDLMHRIAA